MWNGLFSYLEIESPTEPGASLWAKASPSDAPISAPHETGITGMCVATLRFHVVSELGFSGLSIMCYYMLGH